MGINFASDLAEIASDGMDIEFAVRVHLQSNHFPPVPSMMVPVALQAIEAMNSEDYEAEIYLPEGVSFRGREFALAYQVVEAFHLHPFIEG